MTALPAPSAATIWPVNMASGKFQGEIATTAAWRCLGIKRLGLHGVVAAEIDRLAQFARRIVNGFARFVNQQRVYPLCSLLVLIGDPVENSARALGLTDCQAARCAVSKPLSPPAYSPHAVERVASTPPLHQ